jgi:hypothetical protein
MHVPVMLIKSSYDKLYRNNGRRDPVSGDNSNKQIFLFRVFRGNKQIDYRQARQLSNLLVCWQGRKSAYYPPVTIYIYIKTLAKSTCSYIFLVKLSSFLVESSAPPPGEGDLKCRGARRKVRHDMHTYESQCWGMNIHEC